MALSTTCLWASVAEIKPWLRFAPTDVADDVLLEAWMDAVTEQIEADTNRIYVSRSITETRSGDGGTRLELRRYPVTAVTSVTLDGTAIAAADYALDAEGGILELQAGTFSATEPGNLVIVYTAGYARASVPKRVLTLGIELLRARYLSWSSNADVYQSVQMGGTSLSPQTDWISIRRQMDALRYECRIGVA